MGTLHAAGLAAYPNETIISKYLAAGCGRRDRLLFNASQGGDRGNAGSAINNVSEQCHADYAASDSGSTTDNTALPFSPIYQ